MGLTENILKSLQSEELKSIEKTAFTAKTSQAKSLFDLLLKYEEEEKVAARFKKAAPKGNISVVRTQLNEILLDAIYLFHAKDIASAEVNELILLIQIFNKKSAYDVAIKLLEKALTIAHENEYFMQQIELLEIKLSLFQTRVLDNQEDKKQTLTTLKSAMLQKQNHLAFQLLLFNQMELLNKTFTIKSAEDKSSFEQIIEDDLMQNESNALSHKALIEYWIIKGQHYSITNQYDLAATSFESLLAASEKNKAIKKQRNIGLLSVAAQLVTYGYILQNVTMMEKAIKYIQAADTYSEIESIAANTFLLNSHLAYFDFTKNKEGLKNTLRDTQLLLKEKINKLKHDVASSLIIACVSGYAEFGEYDSALEVIHELNEFIFSKGRIDARVTLSFYELIAQIETGNEMVVYDTIQNFNRFLLRHDFKGEFEQVMIKFLKIISSHELEKKVALQALKDQLLALPTKSIQSQNRVLFQILQNMIESKLVGKKYHEYLQEIENNMA